MIIIVGKILLKLEVYLMIKEKMENAKTELNSDYLFSFDGDGDRILFKDNKRIYEGDLIIFILANCVVISIPFA